MCFEVLSYLLLCLQDFKFFRRIEISSVNFSLSIVYTGLCNSYPYVIMVCFHQYKRDYRSYILSPWRATTNLLPASTILPVVATLNDADMNFMCD